MNQSEATPDLPWGFTLERRRARALSPPWWGSLNETIPAGWYWEQYLWPDLPKAVGPFANRIQATRSAWLNHTAMRRPRATRSLVLTVWGDIVLAAEQPASSPSPASSS